MLSSKFVRTKTVAMTSVLRYASLGLTALILAGCISHEPTTLPSNIQDEAASGSDYYLQQLQQSNDSNKADWQLLAIRALLREGKLPQATDLLGKMPTGLSTTQSQEQQLLNIELAVANQQNAQASKLLTQLDPSGLSANQKSRYYQAVISATPNSDVLTLVRAYIAQQQTLSGDANQANLDKTWQSLAQLSSQDAGNLVINADENVLQGWLDLLRVYQDNKQDPAMLKAGIKDWQNRYPLNPAAKNLPTQLNNVLNFSPASTTTIALLLPLSGQAKVYGNAIQQGFQAANSGTDSTPATPAAPATPPAATTADGTTAPATPAAAPAVPATPVAPAVSSAQIKVYDTDTQPLPVLLAQAKQDGATLVVGPLLKKDVDQLATTPTTLNVLALNQPENAPNSPNICYFALSPEDEARDAARHIWAQHKQMPLLLTPRGAFGDRIAKAFADEWQKAGGNTVLQQSFGSTAELKQGIDSGAGIRITGQPVLASAPAAAQSVTIGDLTIPAPPADVVSTSAPNGNVDSVYIVATQAELTLIKTMITMATSSRSGLALYASSRSYQAGAGPDYRLEMEGVQFSDIPLLTGANPALMQQASSQFGNDYSQVRLYAMGRDAWSLANHFAQMRQLPGFQVAGSTGVLTANANCVISRKLSWLQYSQGSLVSVP